MHRRESIRSWWNEDGLLPFLATLARPEARLREHRVFHLIIITVQ